MSDHIDKIRDRHKRDHIYYTTQASISSQSHAEAQEDRGTLLQEVGLMEVRLEQRDKKIENQAVEIARLLASREGLKKTIRHTGMINNDLTRSRDYFHKQWAKLRDDYIQLARRKRDADEITDDAHQMVFNVMKAWSTTENQRDEARMLAKRFYKLFKQGVELLGWLFMATETIKWVDEEIDEALAWDILEFMFRHHPEPELREEYRKLYMKVTGHEDTA